MKAFHDSPTRAWDLMRSRRNRAVRGRHLYTMKTADIEPFLSAFAFIIAKHFKQRVTQPLQELQDTQFDSNHQRMRTFLNQVILKPLASCLGRHIKPLVTDGAIATAMIFFSDPRPSLNQRGGLKPRSLNLK
ncbi:hypothetical protein EVAR_36252_1 [Eumeta japonica]|uniref:Uncharacterized protein n=1 Tax=Eumeta variegata TaxID=151549 RepID=A0A4C1WZN0_EUMVA|nr:hypothetical protein EVAR_36252_1 [Eumeta japonica]